MGCRLNAAHCTTRALALIAAYEQAKKVYNNVVS